MHVHKMSLNRDTPGALAGGRAEQRRVTAIIRGQKEGGMVLTKRSSRFVVSV